MREAEVDLEVCDGCQDCLEGCVYDAIDLVRIGKSKRLKAKVDPERCCGCHECAQLCPQHGIAMNWLGRIEP
ncbi:MAG: 4Fe-4S dicluster domain-containing protein [Chloroflexi bacterium]|nr:4Fe-4S dicluster domain-containing protein [Chloroflexota bacterium]